VTTAWVRSWVDGASYVESLGGVDWGQGRPPPRWHRCAPQTRASINGTVHERCRCGAHRPGGRGPWLERNQTRRRARWSRREAGKPQVGVTCRCGTVYQATAGSEQARSRTCNNCWADAMVAGFRRES
jgi:hypothetical protein